MRKRLSVALLSAAVAAVVPAAPAEAFILGVSAGEVRPKSALLWTRANRSGPVTLKIAEGRSLRRDVREFDGIRARPRDDNTVLVRVRRLEPDTRYFFRFFQRNAHSQRGTFVTAPRARDNERISFAISGDADAQPAAGQTAPFWNNFQAYRSMARERNEFNINLGDVIYSDTEVPGAGLAALTVEEKWAKYRQNIGQRNLQRLRKSAGTYTHWDDHEFINDFSLAENGRQVYNAGVQAFLDYNPATFSRGRGLYRTFRWGRNAELFFLDERSFRSAKASEGGTCNNPDTGSPDLAPTAPPTTRTVFSALVPSLGAPVSQQCLDRIRDPSRTMLGASQLDRFMRQVDRSTARWKIIVNEVPIQEFYALPYDRWEGYEFERERLIEFLRTNVKNVVFLTTDVHATLVNTIKIDTLGQQGPPRDSGIFDLTFGPVATATFATEINRMLGPGNAEQVDTLFFEGALQMACSEIDTYSYGQVDVNSSRIRITPKNLDGKRLVNKSTGQPCGPFEIEAD